MDYEHYRCHENNPHEGGNYHLCEPEVKTEEEHPERTSATPTTLRDPWALSGGCQGEMDSIDHEILNREERQIL